MGIDLNWERDDGELIEQVCDQQNVLARRSDDLAKQPLVCLAFLDPYGDTVFNQNQLPVLL